MSQLRKIQYVGRKPSYTDTRIAGSGLHWRQPGAVVTNVPLEIAKRLLAHPQMFYDCTDRSPKEVGPAFNIQEVALRRANYDKVPFEAVGCVVRRYDERDATMTVEFLNEREEVVLITMPLGLGNELAIAAEQLEEGTGGVMPFEETAEGSLPDGPGPDESDPGPVENSAPFTTPADAQAEAEATTATAPVFSTDDLEAIRQGIDMLDGDNPEHFSAKTGKPNVAALETLIGREISADDRDLVWDDVLQAREELEKAPSA